MNNFPALLEFFTTVVRLLFVFSMTAVILGPCIKALDTKCNLPDSERCYQFGTILVAVLWVFLTVMGMEVVISFFLWLLDILSLLMLSIPWIGKLLSSIFLSLFLSLESPMGSFVFSNFWLTGTFLLVKLMILPLLAYLWRNNSDLFEWTSHRFYKKTKTKAGQTLYVLKTRFTDLRSLTGWFYIGACTALLIAVWAVQDGEAVSMTPMYLMSAAAVLVIGEFFCFLDGSYRLFKSSRPIETHKTAECHEIQNGLLKLFGDRQTFSDDLIAPVIPDYERFWEKGTVSDDDLNDIASEFFQNMKQSGFSVDSDYVAISRNLLHGTSTLVLNPFYKDFSDYLILPIMHYLLNNQTVLIVYGRYSNGEDVLYWVRESIIAKTNLPKLWPADYLPQSGVSDDIVVGLLGFQDIYNRELLEKNRGFLKNVQLVIMIEPSNMIGTGQVGLRTLFSLCDKQLEDLTFCFLDRNAEGLVDALSHMVKQPITEVYAPPLSTADFCRSFWNAEGYGVQTRILPQVSKYLGFGTELSAAALQIGASNMQWYSAQKSPLLDVHWTANQYFPLICSLANLIPEQSKMDEFFHYHRGLWHAKQNDRAFLVIEDEFCNSFDIARTFSTRLKQKGYINILSEDYLLREYLSKNPVLFTNDPKAVPSIVPDYARTERNFVIRMLMQMSIYKVKESVLSQELSVHAIPYLITPKEALSNLITKHTGIEDNLIQASAEIEVVGGQQMSKFVYSVSKESLRRIYNNELQSAFFIVENEESQVYPMGNRLMGHIWQTLLPNQFFTWDGKYYQVQTISDKYGIIVRRAADHFNHRTYYRQLRNYDINIHNYDSKIHELRRIRIHSGFATITVKTTAYLDMLKNSDIANAVYVPLSEVHERVLVNKEFLVLEFPDSTPEIRYTLCMLFNELFKTVYPNETGYLTAVPDIMPDSVVTNADFEKKISSIVYPADIHGEQFENALYIIEDSNIDLGLFVSFERFLQKFLEIIADYLNWQNPGSPLFSSKKPSKSANYPDNASAARAKDWVSDDMTNGIEEKDLSPENTENTADIIKQERKLSNEKSDSEDRISYLSNPFSKKPGKKKPESTGKKKPGNKGEHEPAPLDPLDPDGFYVGGEDEEEKEDPNLAGDLSYLTFGYSEVPDWLDLENVQSYLEDMGFLASNIHTARTSKDTFDYGSTYEPAVPGIHYCDFCGSAMKPGEFTVLKDGRERCAECSKDAVKSVRQFKIAVKEVLADFEKIFGVSFQGKVSVKMANAKKINGKSEFAVTPEFDPRVLGFAELKKGKMTVYVENGAPAWTMKTTLVHELTHIWQFQNWLTGQDVSWLKSDPTVDSLYSEGMAVWAEVQYLLSKGQKERAIRYKRNRENETSAYGIGLKLYMQAFPPVSSASVADKQNPFKKIPPIQIEKRDPQAKPSHAEEPLTS